jgi:hypothetical protein
LVGNLKKLAPKKTLGKPSGFGRCVEKEERTSFAFFIGVSGLMAVCCD